MNETIIKEIKSIYSSRVKSVNQPQITPEIKSVRPEKRTNKTFFNGVIDKLNIIVNKER